MIRKLPLIPGAVNIGGLIERREGVKGSRPIMTGTGMSVHRVAALFRDGETPDEIHKSYAVPLSHVYAAIAYYHANRDEIDGYLREDALAFEEGLKAQESARMKRAV